MEPVIVSLPTAQPAQPAQAALAPPADQAEAAYHRIRPEIDAVAPQALGRQSANVVFAVMVVLGALPYLATLHAAMLRLLPGLDPALIDKLRDYAYALMHVQAMGAARSEGARRVKTLVAEAGPLRERLLAQAEAFVTFGLFDAEVVAAIRRGTGHVDTANDLMALGQLFRARWRELEGKTPLTPAEIARAGALGLELVEALGQREAGTEDANPADAYAETRAKLFHLFVQAHGQMRRAVVYLRWDEGDADTLWPSLFRGRPRKARGPSEPAAPEPSEPNGPAAPEPTAPEPSEPNGPAAPEPAVLEGKRAPARRRAPRLRARSRRYGCARCARPSWCRRR